MALRAGWALALTALAGCQSYTFVFQPDADRQAVHLVFKVQQPSKADILFVVDNSTSMHDEQVALQSSFQTLIRALASQDTRYRIGIVSTDAQGLKDDCNEVAFPDGVGPAGRGNCARSEVELKVHSSSGKLHDGARGRLIAAYDPALFEPEYAGVLPEGTATFASVLAEVLADVQEQLDRDDAGQVDADVEDIIKTLLPMDETGARTVIDRQQIQLEACVACDCTRGEGEAMDCNPDNSRTDTCARAVAQTLTQLYFRSNMEALGTSGSGYEEGIKSALRSIGVDPEYTNDESALSPPEGDNTADKQPNSLVIARNSDGRETAWASWVRDEALFAVMFVTDEEDCSMPRGWRELACGYEEGCGGSWVQPVDWLQRPEGSMCYQDDVVALFEQQGRGTGVNRLADLLRAKKAKDGSVQSRLAVGLIGGVQPANENLASGVASDCSEDENGEPSYECACLNAAWDPTNPVHMESCAGWCEFTTTYAPSCSVDQVRCDALAANRYMQLANRFGRRVVESICRDDFSAALQRFTQVLRPCFTLEGIEPIDQDPANIIVKRATRLEAEAGVAPVLMSMTDEDSADVGWYYNTIDNEICLTGVDRLIGDVYDIFVFHHNREDFSH